MVPPRFEGPTHPCPRCGEVVGGFTNFRVENLKHVGWAPYRVETYVGTRKRQSRSRGPLLELVQLVPLLGDRDQAQFDSNL